MSMDRTVRVESIAAPSDLAVRIELGRHAFIGDEPDAYGGRDLGPAPFQLLSAALAECTVMWLSSTARRQGWPLERVTVEVRRDRIIGAQPGTMTDRLTRVIRLEGDALTAEQRRVLVARADGCPVHRTLSQGFRIDTGVAD